MTGVYKKIIEAYDLSIMPEKNKLLKDTFLKGQKSVIVFHDLPYDRVTLFGSLIAFMKKMFINFIMVVDGDHANREEFQNETCVKI